MEKKQYKEMHDVIIEECGRALDAIDADDVLRYIGMIQSAEKVFFVAWEGFCCHWRLWQNDMPIWGYGP